MKLKYRCEFYDGHTEELIVSPMAMIGWEKWSGKTMGSLGDGLTMEDMTWLAWEQARLRQVTTDEFEVWASTLADLDVIEDKPPTSGDEAA